MRYWLESALGPLWTTTRTTLEVLPTMPTMAVCLLRLSACRTAQWINGSSNLGENQVRELCKEFHESCRIALKILYIGSLRGLYLKFILVAIEVTITYRVVPQWYKEVRQTSQLLCRSISLRWASKSIGEEQKWSLVAYLIRLSQSFWRYTSLWHQY